MIVACRLDGGKLLAMSAVLRPCSQLSILTHHNKSPNQ